jgi:hypothetical protein
MGRAALASVRQAKQPVARPAGNDNARDWLS